MSDISKAVDCLINYNPALAYTDFSEIHMWINGGCDMDKDIIPAMLQVMSRKKDITKCSYFRPAVYALRDSRIETEKALKRRNTPKASIISDDVQKAKHMAWCRDKGLRPLGYDEGWLQQYEERNGQVTA